MERQVPRGVSLGRWHGLTDQVGDPLGGLRVPYWAGCMSVQCAPAGPTRLLVRTHSVPEHARARFCRVAARSPAAALDLMRVTEQRVRHARLQARRDCGIATLKPREQGAQCRAEQVHMGASAMLRRPGSTWREGVCVSSCRHGEAAKAIHVRTRRSLRLQRAANPGCGGEARRPESGSTGADACARRTGRCCSRVLASARQLRAVEQPGCRDIWRRPLCFRGCRPQPDWALPHARRNLSHYSDSQFACRSWVGHSPLSTGAGTGEAGARHGLPCRGGQVQRAGLHGRGGVWWSGGGGGGGVG